MTATPPPTALSPITRVSGWLRREFALRDFLPALPTALLCWFLTVVISVSLAALIFRGDLQDDLDFGIGMALFSAAAAGLVITFLGKVPGTVVVPSDRTAPMLAILTGAVVAAYPGDEMHTQRLQMCLAALVLSTLLTGIVLALLGHYKLGRLIRFLPFPVVGGFMAGAGWLLVKGAFRVVLEFEPELAQLPQVFSGDNMQKWGPAMALGVILVVVIRRWRHVLIVPSILIAAIALFYSIAWSQGWSIDRLRAERWLPDAMPEEMTWRPIPPQMLITIDWNFIVENTETMATILLVTAISLLMISGALELTLSRDVDADRELEAAGIGNLAAVVGGGLVSLHSLSLTSLSLRLGPHSRWVGLLTAIGAGLTLLAGPAAVSYVPMPIIGGLLCFIGLNFLAEWLVESYARVPRSDYLIIVLILIVIAWCGYIPGVGIGLITAVALFALRYSRIDVVRLELCGSQSRSNVDRTPEERAVLAREQSSIHIFKLQGYIFFGTAHSLLNRVKRRVHDSSLTPLRHLVMDFRHVTGLDSSALQSFSKLQQMAKQFRFEVICCGLPPRVLDGLRREPGMFRGADALLVLPDMDYALEWCERGILEPHAAALEIVALGFDEILRNFVQGRAEVANRLVPYFKREEIPAGTTLAVQGEFTRDLFLIQTGQVSAHFKPEHGPDIRLRTLCAGSVAGEIGMYLQKPRTASLLADTDCIIWRLTPETVEAMEKNDPQAAASLHEAMARMVANRLVQANELLETTMR